MHRLESFGMRLSGTPTELSHSQEEIREASVTRFTLPLLRDFVFIGPVAYLEDLVDLLRSDYLESFWINLFKQTTFTLPNLLRFLTESTTPKPKIVELWPNGTSTASLLYSGPGTFLVAPPSIVIGFSWRSRRITSAAQICSELAPFFSAAVELVLPRSEHVRLWSTASCRAWTTLFSSFPKIRILHMPSDVAEGIARALQSSLDGRYTVPLRRLRKIFLLTEGATPILDGLLKSREEEGHTIRLHRFGDTSHSTSPPSGVP
ncbi:hypothetical protein BC834DRAFT_85083 [Gloeopeniophorella convolvens]|nr:hypothetical protein BC834DRAFT_85083 [Gloeopeniophorella convolvens]